MKYDNGKLSVEPGEKLSPDSRYPARLVQTANFLISVANYALLLNALHVDLQLRTEPLVRTQDRTPGQRTQLAARVRFESGSAAIVNCLRLVWAVLGMNGIKTPPDGPLSNTKVQFIGKRGFSELDPDPTVWFTALGSGKSPVDVRTGADGVATTQVEGRPQRQVLPKDAPQVTRPRKSLCSSGLWNRQ